MRKLGWRLRCAGSISTIETEAAFETPIPALRLGIPFAQLLSGVPVDDEVDKPLEPGIVLIRKTYGVKRHLPMQKGKARGPHHRHAIRATKTTEVGMLPSRHLCNNP